LLVQVEQSNATAFAEEGFMSKFVRWYQDKKKAVIM
jgi:hypothetical protein